MKVVQPPKEDPALVTTGKWLYEGLNALGMTLDLQGFLIAWTGGNTKMVVETDADNKIISGALVVIGTKWMAEGSSATILDMRGDRAKLLEYITNLSTAFNLSHVDYEALEGEPGELSRVHRITL